MSAAKPAPANPEGKANPCAFLKILEGRASVQQDSLVTRLLKPGRWEAVRNDPRMNRQAVIAADKVADEACQAATGPRLVLATWMRKYLEVAETLGVKKSGAILDTVVLLLC